MEHIFRNARLPDGRTVDIAVAAGLIADVRPHDAAIDAHPLHERPHETDLGGWLGLPAMAEPHAHIDKALTSEVVPNPTGDLQGAIDAWVAASERGVFTHDDMVRRVRSALEKLLLNGVTAVRSHINTGGRTGLSHLLAAQKRDQHLQGLVEDLPALGEVDAIALELVREGAAADADLQPAAA